jgi:4-amino-4-deoxy-L-arabinose transferase-like glycosyltransferase
MPTAPSPAPARATAPLGWPALALLGLVAALARTFNLGTFSLWLDEFLLMMQSQGGPRDVWLACRSDVEHPPLAALVTAAGNALGVSDTVQRLVPIALGVGTVLLLARWTARRAGRAAGVAAGLFAALLPFAVRYSQELRPYPYLLFFAAAALVAVDRVVDRPGRGSTALLALTLLLGLYAHDLFVLVLAPAGLPLLELALSRDPGRRRAGRRALRDVALAGIVALVGFLPWLSTMLGIAHLPPAGFVRPWTSRLLAERWEFLTVAGVEGDRLTWAGLLALALAALGLAALAVVGTGGAGAPEAPRAAARAALLGLLVGAVGVERFLLADHHWTAGRYDAVGWLFLPPLLGAGVGLLWRRRALRPLAAAALAALLAGEVAGLARYARIGRPDWDRVARDVRRAHRPGEPVLVENDWTRISLAYYLQGRDFERRRGEELAPVEAKGGPAGLAALWPADRGAALVLAASPKRRDLRAWAWSFPLLGRYPRSMEARAHRLTPEIRQRLFASGQGAAGPGAPGPVPTPVPAEDREPPPDPLLLRLERLGGRYER